jgi:hypothetical protein
MKPKPIITSLTILIVLFLGLGLAAAQESEPGSDIGAQAAVGTSFTYQGRLTDGGSPANGQYDFRFRLYDDAGGGFQVGVANTLDNVTVTEGLFTVKLSFGANFNGTAYWLDIGVRPGDSTGSYTTLTPRQELTPTPYALALPGLWTEQNGTSPNLIGGHTSNSVATGVVGATYRNRVSGNYATIGGGDANTASSIYATVGGGQNNTASASQATVGGGSNNLITATHGTIAGGYQNVVTGTYGAVGGGYGNTASDSYTTVGGGWNNAASNFIDTVGGGRDNIASGSSATVGGGWGNTASSRGAVVGGGDGNTATGDWFSTVGGGNGNTASGYCATVPGGIDNVASGDYSFAAGRRAQANHDGTIILADGNNFDFASVVANTFRVRATGGIRFVLGIDGSGGMTWSCLVQNGTSWSCSSDRNLKENLNLVDGGEILQRLAEMPVYTWNGKGQDPALRHMGPMAQDFYAAFGLGGDDTHIATIDLDGVALAAIQGLYVQNQALETESAKLHQRIDALEARLSALEAQAAAGSAASPIQANLLSGAGLFLAGSVGLWLVVRRKEEKQ